MVESCGVAIYVRDHIECSPITDIKVPKELETIWLKVNIPSLIGSSVYICTVYYPPRDPHADLLVDHLVTSVDSIRARDNKSAFVILGDFNDLDTEQLEDHMSLSQIVTFPTHKKKCLDKILTDIKDHYEPPEKHSPLGKSYHCVVVWKPLKQIHKPRTKRVNIRPLRDSCIRSFGQWITQENWESVYQGVSGEKMAQNLEDLLRCKYEDNFPTKTVIRRDNDKAWMNDRIRRLIDQRQRAYKSGNITLWKEIRNKVCGKIKHAKKKFYAENVEGLKKSQPSRWHKNIRNLTGHNNKAGDFDIPGLGNSVEDQSEKLNEHFSAVCCELPPLRSECLPAYLPAQPPPKIDRGDVLKQLNKLNASKAGHPEDIPIKLIKEFSFELSQPLCSIFNVCLQEGSFPSVWKTAAIIPVPKVNKPTNANQLRPIALTKILGRVFEAFLAQWLKDDFSPQLDCKQYGNVKATSTTHYLVDMLNTVVSGIDKPGKYATLCTVDFTKAFDRINHNVAVTKIIKSGVRPSIIPTICSFLSNRTQCVRFRGHLSNLKTITCSVPQGTKLGPGIFSVVVNDAADTTDFRWKFVDDLTLGEIINIRSDSPPQLQFHLNALDEWCKENDMLPKPSKCHVLNVNFLKTPIQYPQLILGGETLETVDNMKLLGLVIQNNLGWDIQVKNMISRASKRLFLLYSLRGFAAPVEDMLTIYQIYIRPLLEYACAVWHSSLTKQQSYQLEKIQKRSCRIILGKEYHHYEHALTLLNLTSLSQRREDLVLKFGQQILQSDRHRHLLPREKTNYFNLRHKTRFELPKMRTNRYQNSTVPFVIQKLNSCG